MVLSHVCVLGQSKFLLIGVELEGIHLKCVSHFEILQA